MAFPDTVETLPDPATRPNALKALRTHLSEIFAPWKADIEGIRTKVGWNNSAVTTSLDYKVTNLPLLIEDVYTSSHTITSLNVGRAITMNVVSANNVTVPTLPAGSIISVYQKGAGQTSFVASGITFEQLAGPKLKLQAAGAQASLWWRTATIVVLSGELVA